jgi:hypothetical protein
MKRVGRTFPPDHFGMTTDFVLPRIGPVPQSRRTRVRGHLKTARDFYRAFLRWSYSRPRSSTLQAWRAVGIGASEVT